MKSISSFLDFLTSIVFIIILVEYFDSVLNRRNISRFLIILIWSIYYIIQLIFFKNDFLPMVNLWLNVFSILIVVCFLYIDNFLRKFVFVITINAIWMVSEIVTGYILVLLGISDNILNIAGSFISKDFMLLIVYIIRVYMKNRKISYIPLRFWIRIGFIPVLSMFIMHNLFIANKNDGSILMVYTSFSAAIILILNIMLLTIFEKLSKDLQLQKENMIYSQQLSIYSRQIEEREHLMNEIRKQRHDIKNELICLKAFAETNDLQSIKLYLADMLDVHDINNQISQSGNVLIDTLLSNKLAVIVNENTDIKIQLEIPRTLPYDPGDLCIIIGNALDNAIEAIRKIDSGKKYLSIFITYNKGNLLIRIENSFSGCIYKGRNGEIITTKKDKVNHGIGLLSINKVVDKYNGLVDIVVEKNVFQIRMILYVKKFYK